VKHIHFTTANPAVSATCQWATIVEQQASGEFSSIDAEQDKRTGSLKVKTTNVACLALDLDASVLESPDFDKFSFEIDGSAIDKLQPPGPDRRYYFTRSDAWRAAPEPPATQKNPARAGPFKHAFNHHAVLVYGTKGSPEENAWMLAKARFDAETIWYRGNGCFDIVADTDFDAARPADRSVILYGNKNINAAWDPLLKDSPLEVHRGGIFIGEHEFKDDWFAALFVRPRPAGPGSPESASLVGAVSFTGMRGARALERLPYFSSGVAYPDWTILSSRVLTEGIKGVEGAGYFDNSWAFDESQAAWLSP
jgi:hypothetical protein